MNEIDIQNIISEVRKSTAEQYPHLNLDLFVTGFESGLRRGISEMRNYKFNECQDPNCSEQSEDGAEYCVSCSPLLKPDSDKKREKLGKIGIS